MTCQYSLQFTFWKILPFIVPPYLLWMVVLYCTFPMKCFKLFLLLYHNICTYFKYSNTTLNIYNMPLDHSGISKHNVVYKVPDCKKYLNVLLADLISAIFIIPSLVCNMNNSFPEMQLHCKQLSNKRKYLI